MSISERIRQCRLDAGLSQERVAELAEVSRQTVTKWETGRSVPGTENLYRLASIFGTTADALALDPPSAVPAAHDAQLCPSGQCADCKVAECRERRLAARRARVKKSLLVALAVAGGYIVVYIIGRLICGDVRNSTVMGLLFGGDSRYYLFGWLMSSRMFWISMGVSVLFALFGRYRIAIATLAGAAIGIPIGEIFGPYDAGVPYGHTHRGWFIWIVICLAGFAVGVVLEIISSRRAKKSAAAAEGH